MFDKVDPAWKVNRIISGLSSGEGVIWKVRDTNSNDEGDTEVPGVSDKRLFVYEGEFASALAVMKREGNILSAVIRNAWDGRILQVATKNSPAKASNAHISILGDITRDELHSALAQAERSNGFANRFLWLHVERCGPKPFGGKALDWTSEVIGLKSAVDFARKQGRVYMDDNARRMWYRERKGAYLAQLRHVGRPR